MKRNLLTTVFCLFAVCAFSQINLGVKAGANFANVTGDDVENADMRISYLAGAYLGIGISEKFKIQPEVLYLASGSKSEYTDFGIDFKETTKLNYISIPVMFIYNVTDMFNVQAGPSVGILASAKTKVEAGDDEEETDIKDSLKGSDFGLNVGLGLDFGKFNVSARYAFGLANIADSDDGDVKNQTIQVAIGYSLFSFGD